MWQAKKARGTFHRESEKVFRGEPYERVMAYFYRGMIYWMEGELDNARACYRSGQLEDADTENKQYASDYVLLDYLDGYITTRLGGDGSDAVNETNGAYAVAVGGTYTRTWTVTRCSVTTGYFITLMIAGRARSTRCAPRRSPAPS